MSSQNLESKNAGIWGRRIAAALTAVAAWLIKPWLERQFSPESQLPPLIAVCLFIIAALLVRRDWFPHLAAILSSGPQFQSLELPSPLPATKYYCERSSRFAMFIPKKNQAIYFVPTEFEWDDSRLVCQVVTDGENPTMKSLADSDELILGYKYHVALSRNNAKRFYIKNGKLLCQIDFQLDKTDFSDPMELGGGSFREQRARILFLNESLPEIGKPPKEEIGDDAMLEYLDKMMGQIQAQGLFGQVDKSPLPELYEKFGNDPQRFIDIAWIHLVISAITREVADEIRSLTIELKLPYVFVQFVGRNRNDELRVIGNCRVAG